MTPNFTDVTASIPGNDGMYYWTTYHNQRNFTIDFAFDDLREEDLRRLKQYLSFKGLQQLIFDEAPYKKYYVKCQNPPVLKYIPFGGLEGMMVYKGEGSVTFVAYNPYAVSTESVEFVATKKVQLDNSGDLDTYFKVYFPIVSEIGLNLTSGGKTIGQLTISGLTRQGTDSYICIDMKTHLIEGMNASFEKTGNLYNRFILSGDFFSVPIGQNVLTANTNWTKLTMSQMYY